MIANHRHARRSLHDALQDGRLARSRAFHDGLSAARRWISGGRSQDTR